MKLIDSNNFKEIDIENYCDNSIFDIEAINLKKELCKVYCQYEQFCSKLYDDNLFIELKGKSFIKSKKLHSMVNFEEIFKYFNMDNNLFNIYNENIKDLDTINIHYVHLIYKSIIQYLCNAINLIRMTKTYKYKKNNPLFELYFEEQKKYKDNKLFDYIDESFNLIQNAKIRNLCQEMIDKYKEEKEALLNTQNDIYNNQRKLELFLLHKRKDLGTIEELKWYSEFLKECCKAIDSVQKQKRI